MCLPIGQEHLEERDNLDSALLLTAEMVLNSGAGLQSASHHPP